MSWKLKDSSYPIIRTFYSDINSNYKEAAEKLIKEKQNETNIEEITVKYGFCPDCLNIL